MRSKSVARRFAQGKKKIKYQMIISIISSFTSSDIQLWTHCVLKQGVNARWVNLIQERIAFF